MNGKTILSLATALALSATMAVAEPGEGHHGNWRGHGGHLAKKLEALDLDAEQQKKVDAILAEARERNEGNREELHAAYEELHSMLDQETPDESAVLGQVEKIGDMKTEAKKAMMKTMLAVRAELTPEQREKLKSMKKERMKRHHEHRKGPAPSDESES